MHLSRLQANLQRWFVSGLFAVIPLGLSLLAVVWSVRIIDDTLAPLLDASLGWHFPGLGLLVASLGVLLVGFLTSHVVGVRLLAFAEDLLLHVPVFRHVYGTVKQMADSFSPENKASFKSVVIVEYPRKGVYRLAFATNETQLQEGRGSKNVVAVYVPTNHVYIGDLVLVPKEEVVYTQMNIQQGIQSMLSAGATLPGRLSALPPEKGA